jgi:hypothetical protein
MVIKEILQIRWDGDLVSQNGFHFAAQQYRSRFIIACRQYQQNKNIINAHSNLS